MPFQSTAHAFKMPDDHSPERSSELYGKLAGESGRWISVRVATNRGQLMAG